MEPDHIAVFLGVQLCAALMMMLLLLAGDKISTDEPILYLEYSKKHVLWAIFLAFVLVASRLYKLGVLQNGVKLK